MSTATLPDDRAVLCPAPRAHMVKILVAGLEEAASHLDVSHGCGVPTPEAEEKIYRDLDALNRALSLATRFREGRIQISEQLPTAIVESMDPTTLFEAVIRVCKMLEVVTEMVPDGLTLDQIREIRRRTEVAFQQIEDLVESVES